MVVVDVVDDPTGVLDVLELDVEVVVADDVDVVDGWVVVVAGWVVVVTGCVVVVERCGPFVAALGLARSAHDSEEHGERGDGCNRWPATVEKVRHGDALLRGRGEAGRARPQAPRQRRLRQHGGFGVARIPPADVGRHAGNVPRALRRAVVVLTMMLVVRCDANR